MTEPARRSLLVGNWKMNLGETAASALVREIIARVPFREVEIGVAPPFPSLRSALDAAGTSPLLVGAQNVHWEDQGAFTGEVAAPMLAEMGVRFVIIGHSERRALFGETDEMVSRKIGAAHRHGLIPLVCVGESAQERDDGETVSVVRRQIRAALRSTAPASSADLVIAYEPVWAIGTGRTPSPAEISRAHAAIREVLEERMGPFAGRVRVLYGGSATPDNAAALLRAPGVDGALVGGASLSAATFAAIAAVLEPC